MARAGLQRPAEVVMSSKRSFKICLKYLAGIETGAGMFINGTFAEEKARELSNHVS
jgi:hypothetical protein